MKVIILIMTLLFPDDTIQSKVFQAPATESMEHCNNVVVPGAIRNMRFKTDATAVTATCFEVMLDLTKA